MRTLPWPHQEFTLVLAFTLTVALGAAQPSHGAEPATLETILAVWRKREAAHSSFKVVLAEQFLTGKNTLMGGPPEDVVTQMRCVIVVDGTKVRCERMGPVWAHTAGAFDQLTSKSVFTGRGSKELFQTARNDDVFHSTGYIRNAERHADVHNVYIAPIFRHFRPLSPVFAVFNFEKLRLVGTREVANGETCLLLEEPQPDKLRLRRFWVAPHKDMAVVRFVELFQGEVDRQVDVSFKADPKRGWVPSTWKGICFGNKRNVLHSATETVTEMELNLAVPASTFDIVFPPKTEVFDRVRKTRFVVKPDGSHRQIMQREIDRGARYSELMKTDVGEGAKEQDAGVQDWLKLLTIAASVIVGAGIVMVFVGRKSRLWFHLSRR